MSKKTENKSINRDRVPDLLATQFIKDYRASLNGFPEDKKVEFIEHILGCFDIVEKYWADQTTENWKVYADKENAFLKKHGKRLKMYNQTQMGTYYGDNHILSQKNIYTTDEWNNLSHEKQRLSLDEMAAFIHSCRNFLYHERNYTLLEQTPEDETTKNASEISNGIGSLKTPKIKREALDKLTSLNQEQTVLLMYYLQQEKVILRGDNLTDLNAGKAFEILTGYSQHTLRQNLSKFYLYQNKINLKEISKLLARLKTSVDKDIEAK
jgi:hypothetical protein